MGLTCPHPPHPLRFSASWAFVSVHHWSSLLGILPKKYRKPETHKPQRGRTEETHEQPESRPKDESRPPGNRHTTTAGATNKKSRRISATTFFWERWEHFVTAVPWRRCLCRKMWPFWRTFQFSLDTRRDRCKHRFGVGQMHNVKWPRLEKNGDGTCQPRDGVPEAVPLMKYELTGEWQRWAKKCRVSTRSAVRPVRAAFRWKERSFRAPECGHAGARSYWAVRCDLH